MNSYIQGLKCTISGAKISCEIENMLVTKGRNQFECNFQFDEQWSGLALSAVFVGDDCGKGYDDNSYQCPIVDGKCLVPAQILQGSKYFAIGAVGVSEEKTYVTNMAMVNMSDGVPTENLCDLVPTPNLWEAYMAQITQNLTEANQAKIDAETAAQLAQTVSLHPPYIGENGNWYTWDDELEVFNDTGFTAQGETGEQGLQGEAGEQGLQGEAGAQGATGAKGKKGDAFTYEDFTEEQLASLKGETGESGPAGQNGVDGIDGQDGLTVSVTLNGETIEHIDGNIDLGNLATETYVDTAIENIDIGGSGGVFDLVIRTQEEFEAMYASVTWLDAKSVCFIGDGGTLEFTRSDGYGLKIPENVRNLQGLNNAKIKIEDFDDTLDCNEAALWYGYDQTNHVYYDGPLRRWIDGLEVISPDADGFRYCVNLTNCIANNCDNGFRECTNLTNVETYDCTNGFYACYRLNNCYATNRSLSGICFFICHQLSNCAGHYGFDIFSGCSQLTNCIAISRATYVSCFVDCNYINGCKGCGATVKILVGANTYVDENTINDGRLELPAING